MSNTASKPAKIIISVQGPMIIKGDCELRNADDCLIEHGEDVQLCRCGNSKNKPFCDKTHEWRDWMDNLSITRACEDE